MADSSKGLEISLKVNTEDARKLDEVLLRLSKSADLLTIKFTAMNAAMTGLSGGSMTTSTGAPKAGVPSGMAGSAGKESPLLAQFRAVDQFLKTTYLRTLQQVTEAQRGILVGGPRSSHDSSRAVTEPHLRPLSDPSVATRATSSLGRLGDIDVDSVTINAQTVNINADTVGGGGGGTGGGGGGAASSALPANDPLRVYQEQQNKINAIERSIQQVSQAYQETLQTSMRFNMLPSMAAAGSQTYGTYAMRAAMGRDLSTAHAVHQLGGYQKIYDEYGMKTTLQMAEVGKAGMGLAKVVGGVAVAAATTAAIVPQAAAALPTAGVTGATAWITGVAGYGASVGLLGSGGNDMFNAVSNLAYDIPEADAQRRVIERIELEKKSKPMTYAAIDAYEKEIPTILSQSRRYANLFGKVGATNYLGKGFGHVGNGDYMRDRRILAQMGMDPAGTMAKIFQYSHSMTGGQSTSYSMFDVGMERMGFNPELAGTLSSMTSRSAGTYGSDILDKLHPNTMSNFSAGLVGRAQTLFSGSDPSLINASLMGMGTVAANLPAGILSEGGYRGIFDMMKAGVAPETVAEMQARAEGISGVSRLSKLPYNMVSKMFTAKTAAQKLGIPLSNDQMARLAEFSGPQYLDEAMLEKELGLKKYAGGTLHKLSETMFSSEIQRLMGLGSSGLTAVARNRGDVMAGFVDPKSSEEEKSAIALRLHRLDPDAFPTVEAARQALEAYSSKAADKMAQADPVKMPGSGTSSFYSAQQSAQITRDAQRRRDQQTNIDAAQRTVELLAPKTKGVGDKAAEDISLRFTRQAEGAVGIGQREITSQLSGVLQQLSSAVGTFQAQVNAAQSNVASMGGGVSVQVGPSGN